MCKHNAHRRVCTNELLSDTFIFQRALKEKHFVLIALKFCLRIGPFYDENSRDSGTNGNGCSKTCGLLLCTVDSNYSSEKVT